MSRPSKRAAIVTPTATQNRAIIKAAKADPDAQPLTRTQLRAMVPLRSMKAGAANAPTPPADPRLTLSIRCSPEVVAYFCATGDDWQARMDAVLCAYVKRQSRRR